LSFNIYFDVTSDTVRAYKQLKVTFKFILRIKKLLPLWAKLFLLCFVFPAALPLVGPLLLLVSYFPEG